MPRQRGTMLAYPDIQMLGAMGEPLGLDAPEHECIPVNSYTSPANETGKHCVPALPPQGLIRP